MVTPPWCLLDSQVDLLGEDYLCHTYRLPGPVTMVESSLVEYLPAMPARTAILYMHGYTDYFFQGDLGPFFAKLGLGFFALDLQGYGRSIRPNTPPNWCDSLSQYHMDIRMALAHMRSAGIEEVVILAHSTGGLIASSYLAKQYDMDAANEQIPYPAIRGLILNSPFLALPFSPKLQLHMTRLIWWVVSALPFHQLRADKISTYARTIHRRFRGEWDYRLDWKPAHGFPLSFHWLKQIIFSQRDLLKQRIPLPTLMCHSKRSTLRQHSVEAVRQGDGVLDVESMKGAAGMIFQNLTQAEIDGGFHDLYLSPEPIRERYLSTIERWLNQQILL